MRFPIYATSIFWAAVLFLFSIPALPIRAQDNFDVVISNSRVMDPESGLDAVRNVGIIAGKIGFSGPAIESGKAALALSHTPNHLLSLATLYAYTGDEKRSEPLLSEAAAKRPDATLVQSVSIPSIRAWVEMNHKNAPRAIELLKGAAPYDALSADIQFQRATAYFGAARQVDAATEFQRVLARKDLWQSNNQSYYSLLHSLAQLGLSRTYAAQGDNSKARVAYQDFFASWKNADPDIPILQQAKAEYAKLQ